MAGESFEWATFDGTVGVPGGREPIVPSRAVGVPVVVSVGGALQADPRTFGLAEDIGLFIQAFLIDPDATRRSEVCAGTAESADASDDIEIAIHGVTLEPEAQAELHQRIRGLVRRRFRPTEESR